MDVEKVPANPYSRDFTSEVSGAQEKLHGLREKFDQNSKCKKGKSR